MPTTKAGNAASTELQNYFPEESQTSPFRLSDQAQAAERGAFDRLDAL